MIDVLATPVDTDIAYQWILTLFPATMETSADAAYGSAFAVFTGMLTFLGSLFMAWHVLQGIVLSAYTGKVLGERFHQIWAPLRVVLGFGMLVPISGGFSSVHYILRNVVGVAAVQMGNAPIKAYITSIVEPTEGKTVVVPSLKGRDVFDAFLSMEVCSAVVNGLDTSIWSSFFGTAPNDNAYPTSGYTKSLIGHDYSYDYGSCGSITFETPEVTETELLKGANEQIQKFALVRAKATNEMLAKLRDAVSREKLAEYFVNHDVREMEGVALLRELRTQGIVPAGLAATKTSAATAWDKAISDSASVIYKDILAQNSGKLLERINTHGFMAAGGFERALSSASSLSVGLSNSAPKISSPELGEKYAAAVAVARQAVVSAPSAKGEDKGDGSMAATDGTSLVDGFYSYIAPAIGAMKAGTGSTTGDPIGDMITFGHNLLALWEAGVAFMLVTKMIAATAVGAAEGASDGGVNFLSGGALGAIVMGAARAGQVAVDFMFHYIQIAWSFLFIVGVIQAFVLPMLPMIMVFIMGVSWLILFLEAAIAGVLWAFAFIRMDGQELFDKNQSPGMTLLFNLFLRPAISMLAFIGGLKLLPEVLNSLSTLWDAGFNAQTTPDLLFIVQYVMGLVMFTWLQWHLTMRIFGLVPTISDNVGNWMGFGQTRGYGDGAETGNAIAAAVAAGKATDIISGNKRGKHGPNNGGRHGSTEPQ